MADVTSNMTIVQKEGDSERVVLYRVKNADTADSVNVLADFVEVKAATFVASGPLTGVGTVSISGTVLTLTLATMTDDNILLLVIGQAK